MTTYFKSSDIHFHALRSAGFITVCTYGPCAGITQNHCCYFEPGKQVEVISRETFEQARVEALTHLDLAFMVQAAADAADFAMVEAYESIRANMIPELLPIDEYLPY